MKILVIIEHLWEIPIYLQKRFHQDNAAPDHILFSPDNECRKRLKKLGIPCTSETDYDFTDSFHGVSEKAYELSENWWKSFVSLLPEFTASGVNIPALIERDATYFFLWVLRNVDFTQSLIRYLNPTEIWIGQRLNRTVFSFRAGKEISLIGCIASEIARQFEIPSSFFKLPLSVRIQTALIDAIKRITLKVSGTRLRETLLRSSLSFRDLLYALVRDLTAFISLSVIHAISLCIEPREKKPVLLVSSSEKHIAPVIEEIKKRKTHHFVYFRETFSPAQAASFLKNDSHFATLSPSAGRLRSAKALHTFWQQQSHRILANNLYTWKGFHFGALLRERFTFLFLNLFPKLMYFCDQTEKMLKQKQVSQILVEEDVCTFNKALIQTANLLNIPSLVVQHGFSVLKVGFYPLSATRFAAFGAAAKRRLIEWGIHEERIAITGNVLHDAIIDNLPSKEDFCNNLGLDSRKKIILLGMFPYRDYSAVDFPEVESNASNYYPFIDAVAEALSEFPDYQLIIKLHPRDSQFYQCTAYVAKFKTNKIVVAQAGPSVQYSKHCDCLITVLSTLLIDTLPFCKPMFVVDFGAQKPEKVQEMISMNIPVVPNKSSEISKTLRHLFLDNTAKKFEALAADHLGLMDHHAAERTADLILKLSSISFKTENSPLHV